MTKNWRVIISPSIFQPSVVLGEYRFGIQAWFAAMWAVCDNPYAEVCIEKRNHNHNADLT